MRLLKGLRRFGRASQPAPKPASSDYDPIPHHSGLIIPAPDAPALPRTPRGGFRIRGEIVADYDVLSGYQDAITRNYDHFDWSKNDPSTSRQFGIFEVAGGIVTRGYVGVDPNRGYLFLNHTYDSFPVAEGVTDARGKSFELSSGKVDMLSGRVVVIGGPFESNFFHGLFNWFSRLIMLDQMAPHLAADPSIRYLVDRRAQSEPFASIVAALGLAADRIIWSDPGIDYRIERAVFVSFLHEGLLCPELIALTASRIRAAFGVEEGEPGWRRIWISREHFPEARRRIDNFGEIAPLLDQHGFESIILEELSFAEQVTLFSEAEIVAGSHGAGFSNIIFCPKNARVILIEKEFTRFTGIANLFANLATISGLPVEIVPAESIHDAGTDYSGFLNLHFADATVDQQAFEDAVKKAVSPRSGVAPAG